MSKQLETVDRLYDTQGSSLPEGLANRYVVWRHGESEANAAEIIISKPENGVNNFGLTEMGVRQIRRTIMLVKNALGIDERCLIYSSPFLRCVQTATEVARVAGVPEVTLAYELRERDFGSFEGTHKENYQKVYKLDRHQPWQTHFGVESVGKVLERATRLVRDLEAKHHDKSIVLVTHADVGEILQTAFLGLPPQTHRELPKLRHSEPRELRFAY